jgi:probable HAF family extracellular repeat protein
VLVVAAAAAIVLACSDSSVPFAPPAPPAPSPDTTTQHGAFGVTPQRDTIYVGEGVVLVAERPSVDEWVLSDTVTARLSRRDARSAVVWARAPGSVTVTARQQGDSGQATVVIPEFNVPGWEAIDLGLPDNAFSGYPSAINDSGVIVGGLWENPANASHSAFIYKKGVMRKLPSVSEQEGYDDAAHAIGLSGRIAGITSGSGGGQLVVWDSPDATPAVLPGTDSHIIGMDARGDILVTHGDVLGSMNAVVWRNGAPEDLGHLNDSLDAKKTFATAWNSNGQIVGGSLVDRFSANVDYYNIFHPFLWEDGVMRDLGVLDTVQCRDVSPTRDCSSGTATGINAHGVVVGRSLVGDLLRAFIWENGVMRDLGVFPGHWTTALAINDNGQILGHVDGYDTVFLWDHGHVQIVVTNRSGGSRGLALGPNGEVVGGALLAGDSVPHAFIWKAGQLTDLGRGSAIAINSRGEIIGTRGYYLPTLWRKKSH